MAQTVIDTFTVDQIDLEGNDTLDVTPVGSIVTADEAIVWNLETGATTPPGIVIVNEGLISSTDDRAIDTDGDSDGPQGISLTNRGTITASNEAFRIGDTLTGGTVLVDNYGTIDSADSRALDFNAVESAASITIYNRVDGLIHAEDADAIRPGAGAVVHSWGHVLAEGGGDGIDFQDDAGGMVNNHAGGLIEGGKHGVTGDEAVTVYNAVGGTIVGNNGSAVNIDNSPDVGDTVSITNYGTMEGRSAETEDSDGDAVDVDGLLALDNYGTIEGLGHEGYHDGGPNVSEGVAMGGGTINNYAGAVIYGYGRAIQADNSDNEGAYAATTIHNEGLIEGAGNGPEGVDEADALPLIPIGNEAINLVGDWADSITNNGQIIGGVMMGDGADTLTNRGSMSALKGSAIDLGAGNDDLILYTGSSVDGAIIGGDGELDFLNLLMDEDALASTGTLSAVSGFEILAVGRGSWTITDTQIYGDGVEIVVGAELVLGEGFAAGEIGGAIVTYGNLAINRGDTYTLGNAISGGGILEQRGTGTTVIAQANAFTGDTLITDGALRLSAVNAIGTGIVGFDVFGGESLILDDAALTDNAFANVVIGLGEGDAIDFTGLAFTAGTRVDYDMESGLVSVIGREATYSFTLLALDAADLVAMSDGEGGTLVKVRDVGVKIKGTSRNDTVDGQKTVLGQMLPTAADDTIDGKRGDDKIVGLAGGDLLKGGDGDDQLFGAAGDDWLHGGTGSNKLSGGADFDAFVFDTKLGKGKAGQDGDAVFTFARIKSFERGEDQILLDRKVFKALDAGPLSPDAFAIGRKAKSADVHILYKDGDIRYDKDGKGGADAVLFAKVAKGLAMDADDFLVI